MSACNWGGRWVDKILIDNNEEWIFVLYISESHDDKSYDCGEIVELCVSWWWFWFDDDQFHMTNTIVLYLVWCLYLSISIFNLYSLQKNTCEMYHIDLNN